MPEGLFGQRESSGKRPSDLTYLLSCTMALVAAALRSWNLFEGAVWWWPFSVSTILLTTALIIAWRWNRLANVTRGGVTHLIVTGMLLTLYRLELWPAIGPVNILIVVGLTLVLWLALWARFQFWLSLYFLPASTLVAVNGYLGAAALMHHQPFMDMVDIRVAAVGFAGGLFFYSFFLLELWKSIAHAPAERREN